MKRQMMTTKRFLMVCPFIVLCFVIQGCYQHSVSPCINNANISSLAEYKEKRNSLIEKIRGETEKLSPQEKRASEQFEMLKRKIYNESLPAAPWISKPFYEVKDEIANTQLYKVIQQMPKGSILHLHPSAMGNLQTAIDKAMMRKDAYVLTKGNNRGMIRFTGGENWIAVSQMEAVGLNKTDLLKCVTIGAEDESIVDIWPEFEQIFGRMWELITNYPYEDYLYEAIEYFAIKDNISHIELREHSPKEEDIELYKRIKKRLADNGIDISISLIYCDTRQPQTGESPDDRCAKLRQSADSAINLMEKYPDMVRGFDVYSEEDKGLPSSLMADLLIEAKKKAAAKGIDFNLYLHGGESVFPVSFNATDEFSKNIPKYYNNNVIDAYLLGAKRVGHGFELAKLPRLAEYYKEHKICVELCPISNQLLRYFKDLRNHPGISLFNQGVPITISPDDPAIFGYQGVSFDYWAAVMAWDMSLADVKKCIINSIEYSSLTLPEKNELMKKWQKKWIKFIEGLTS
jgi:adenosine deaminase CECR1